MSIEVGTVYGGRYEIRARIGSGGMGEVYKAEDRVLQRAVAIKFIDKRKHPSETAAKRFLREARSASRLNHPNIVVIHEITETEEHAYIVMEFVSGKSLREHIRAQSFTPDVLLDLAAQLADALAEAHAHGVIHRDLKPENILVNERGHAKLLDFGLARDIERARPLADEAAMTAAAVETLTGASAVVGTIPYMSPEQLRKETLDARTDIFSYGIVLHEMFTGRHPFWATSSFEIAAAILAPAPVAVSDVDPRLPPSAATLLARLLEKGRERRPSSFAQVREALHALKGELRFGSSGGDATPTRPFPPSTQDAAAAETAVATSQ
ncbi:MAG TPA: serine/threonine-protein kinase, partial [Pyrinomonadaceae bacterium]|nr:serine/threonine-protein kinase [Pyrinomonadaceae bacterium]